MNWAKKTRRVTSFCHLNYGFPSISRPEKSRNNTGEKILGYFFMCVWYCQSDTDTSLAFHTTWSVWWMNRFFTCRQWCSNFSRRGRTLKYKKKNWKLYLWLWWWHFLQLRTKIINWKIHHRPILAVYLKDFFYW